STAVGPAIGIATAEVREAPATLRVRALARIAYDATRHAWINPRATGVVQEIRVDVGSRVVRGDVLATIASSDLGDLRARITSAQARVNLARIALERQDKLVADGSAPQRQRDEAQAEL